MLTNNFETLIINNKQILDVIRKTLSYVDTRLIDHGERVAFIALNIVKDNDILPPLDLESLYILSVLHDIGAYKTEEINNMLQFETFDVDNHSMYGYLFLKYLSPLKDIAKAVLYHHTDYAILKDKNDIICLYSQIIFLADRIDILSQTTAVVDANFLKEQSYHFHPALINLFLKNDKKFKIVEQLNNGSYKLFIEKFNNTIIISNNDIWQYLNMLVFSIDFRSQYTVNHTIQTSTISIEIARLLDMSEFEVDQIYAGAILHDLGKMAIPYTILEKADKLTAAEMEIMRLHVTYTEEIISGVVNEAICKIASRHHEKLNGCGYPNGLSKKDLSIAEQIVAIADILSALSQPRSYKIAFDKAKVMSILGDMENKGEIDSALLNLICKNYDYLLAKAHENSAPILKIYHNIFLEFDKLKAYKAKHHNLSEYN